MSKEPPDDYHAFLLRLWRDGDNEPWRVTVQDTRTGERKSFPGLDALLAFLKSLAQR